MYRLNDAIVQRFRHIVIFEIGPHHINIHPHQEQQQQIFPTKFI